MIAVEKPIQLNLLTIPREPVEGQEANLLLTIANPSSLDVEDVEVKVTLKGVDSPTAPIEVKLPTLRARAAENITFTIIPSQVRLIEPSATITFNHGGEALLGEVSATVVSVAENMQMRYGLPVALGVVLVLAIAYLARRQPKSGKA